MGRALYESSPAHPANLRLVVNAAHHDPVSPAGAVVIPRNVATYLLALLTATAPGMDTMADAHMTSIAALRSAMT